MKHICTIEGKSRLTLEFEPGSKKSKHLQTQVALQVSGSLDASKYTDDGQVTQLGLPLLVYTYIQGLVACIHVGRAQGWRNDVEHLQYIIAELTRGFAENVDISAGTMKTKLD